MAPTEKPGPDASRKNRSFGPLLLFLFVLVLVLAVVGGGQLSTKSVLSQDQYLWYLYNGWIQGQKFDGTKQSTNLIEGTYRLPGEVDKVRLFEVGFADVATSEERFRGIAAESKIGPIQPEALSLAVSGGWYEPVEMRSLTSHEELPEAAAAPAGSRTAAAHPLTREKLWVHVLTRSKRAWEESVRAQKGDYDPTRDDKFELFDQPLHVWVEVRLDRVDDLGGLLATLQSNGAPLERLSFDLAPSQGSRWNDATSRMLELFLLYAPWVLILVVFLFFMRQLRSQGGAGGVMSFGRSRAQLYTKENRTNVTFDDVAGAEEAKAEVRELVEFLKNPGRFTRIGGRIPRGVLLVGPPGCGKTLLAKAIAGEAEVPFFSISGSDFVEMFVGVGASRVRDLFKQARENSPCIIFLDEIDAVGRRRGSGLGGGHDEREQTLNAILVEMDGFSTDEGIIVVAATNRPDVLDPALLRPGRFDREVVMDLPDYEGRRAILKVHMKKVRHGPEVDIDILARSTPGYSGADLAAVVNEAAIMAVLDKRELVTMADLDEARDKTRYGRQKRSRKIEEEDRRITAYHEAGHAVVAALLPEADDPHKVTIVPRGRTLGTTMILPERESYHMQKRRLLGQLSIAFGGRAAEEVFCGDVSAGASDDIKRATELARAMVTELGMSTRIGPIHYAEREGSDFLGAELGRGRMHSEETAREIDQEVQGILLTAYSRALEIVREHRTGIEELTRALLLYETLSGQEVRRVLAGESHESLRPGPAGPTGTETRAAPSAPPSEGRASPGFSGQPGLSPA